MSEERVDPRHIANAAELVKETAGMATKDIAERLALSERHMRKVLTLAARRGLVVSVRIPGTAIWATPEAARSIQFDQKERLRARKRFLYAKERGHADGGFSADPPDMPIVRRLVSAAGLAPPVTSAARSVFEFGGVS